MRIAHSNEIHCVDRTHYSGNEMEEGEAGGGDTACMRVKGGGECMVCVEELKGKRSRCR